MSRGTVTPMGFAGYPRCSRVARIVVIVIVPILIAPRFHPTSSCSWRRLGVLSWWWSSLSSLVVVVVVVVVLPSSSSSSSLLKVVGGASSARHCRYMRAGVLTWCPAPSPLPSSSRPALVVIIVVLSSCRHRHHSTRYPPHEQLLVRLGAGGVVFAVRRCCLAPENKPLQLAFEAREGESSSSPRAVVVVVVINNVETC